MDRTYVSARYSREQLAMLSTITTLLDRSTILDDALRPSLQTVCVHLGWTVGALWLPDVYAGVLKCRCIYHRPDADASLFEMITRAAERAPGEGIVGRVWTSGHSEWIEDLRHVPGFRRLLAARRAKLRSCCMLPIWSHGSVRGVIEFYSSDSFVPTEEVREMLQVIAGQFGQFLARLDAEQALRESEEHVSTLVAHAPVFLFAVDRDGVFTMSEGGALEALGYMPGESMGQSIFDIYHDAPAFLAAVRKALSGETVTATLRARGRILEAYLAPQYVEGQVVSVAGVATDITPQVESLRNLPSMQPRPSQPKSGGHGR